ncbi:hypothetical protein [Streptococcus equinus]|uniref:hypothetical protein n=1 Tax=Streptococcus equinus TaxID=1335 RepID=UPI003BF7916B
MQAISYKELSITKKDLNNSIGLVHRRLGKYDITDIEFVAAFDISKTKVGEDLSDAIFKYPNNTKIVSPVPKLNVIVEKGPVLDVWNEKFAVFLKFQILRHLMLKEYLEKLKQTF